MLVWLVHSSYLSGMTLEIQQWGVNSENSLYNQKSKHPPRIQVEF